MIVWLLALASPPLQVYNLREDRPLSNDAFYVQGRFCEGVDCAKAARFSGSRLIWDVPRSTAAWHKLPRLQTSWRVSLLCDRSGDRIIKCRERPYHQVSDQSSDIARRIVGQARLDVERSSKAHKGQHVSLTIVYDVAGCPPWRCIIEHLPPLPPPPSSESKVDRRS